MANTYEYYKESDIDWIGSIPRSWKTSKLKWFSKIFSGGTPSKNIDSFWENGTIPWLNSGTVNQRRITKPSAYITQEALEKSSAKWINKGAILMALAGQGKTKGMAALLEFDATCNQSMGVIEVDRSVALNEFILFWLESNYSNIRSMGGGDKRDGINLQILGEINCPLPKLKEQLIISDYLKHKTNLINSLIDKKENLIQKLIEQRKSMINEAFTRGIKRNISYKNSAVDWLGEIPKDWSYIKISTVAKDNQYSITGGPFGSDLKNEEFTSEGVRIIQLQNIGVGTFKDHYKIFTSEKKADELFSCNIFPGDLIIAKMADPVARACIMPDHDDRYIMASDGIRFEVDETKAIPKFLEYAINSKYFNFQAELKSTGTTRLRIGLTEFKKLKILLPDLEEQKNILSYVESYDFTITKSINDIQKSISQLKNYRQSIISEAVTGKIDVRYWKPKINSNGF